MDKRLSLRFEVTPAAYIVAAFSLLILPPGWMIAMCFAALIHELTHIFALKLCAIRIHRIVIGGFGAKIHTDSMSDAQELLCAAAGPAGSLILLVFIRIFPLVGILGLFHGLCNLLPVYPMDGGRILKAFLKFLLPKASECVYHAVEMAVFFLIELLGIYIFFQTGKNAFVLLCMIFPFLRWAKRKIPCKEARLRVQ